MATFEVAVDFAHDKDALMAGQVVIGTHYVTVEADTLNDGMLLAEQMVACRFEPTDARWIA